MDETSIPGPGGDHIDPEFEKSLQDEGFELNGRPKADDEKKPEPVVEKKPDDPEDKKPLEADKKSDEEGDKKPDDKKAEKGNEEWRQMVAKRRQEKPDKPAGAEEKPADPDKPAPLKPVVEPDKKPDAPVLSEGQKAFAEKYGIEPDDLVNLFPATKQEAIVKEGMSEEDRKTLQEYRQQRDDLLIEKGFGTDFESNVLPLLKEEYPTISDAKVKEIKEQIFEKLKTDEFARTPLDVIYRGDKTFRGLVATPKNGIDSATRVPAKGDSGKVYDFESVTEDDIKKSDFPFQEYSDYMAKKEKGK